MKINGRVATVLVALSALAGGAMAVAPPAASASLTEVTSFGSNPGGMRMHLYVPDNRQSRPGVLVAMHGCGGSGPGFYSGSEFASLADRYGFIVIYPSAQQQAGFGNCFDTWSDAAKRRGGGSDPVSIVSMIDYVQRQYDADPSRVFATGSSSGGMMTQHLLAVYPDVFSAGASFMGVPYNCFANAADYPPGASRCTGGGMNRSPQEWGDAVRQQAYPGYSGRRPPIQLWHGTNDTLVPYSLLQESVEQWTNVFGLGQTPTSTDSIRSGWNRSRFADSSGAVKVESISVQGAGHSLPEWGMAAEAIAFFGLDRPVTTTTTTTTTQPTTTTTTTQPTTTTTTEPTTTTTTTTTTTRTTSGGSVGCSATLTVMSAWPGGFVVDVEVRAATALNGWKVALRLPDQSSIGTLWNGVAAAARGDVTVTNESYNGRLDVGQTAGFGFVGNGDFSGVAALGCSGA